MRPHEQRVLDEEKDLAGNLEILRDFFATGVFLDLDSDSKGLLRAQSVAMASYLEILRQRIAGFAQ